MVALFCVIFHMQKNQAHTTMFLSTISQNIKVKGPTKESSSNIENVVW